MSFMQSVRESKTAKVLGLLGLLGVAKEGLEAIADNVDAYVAKHAPAQQEYRMTAEDSVSYPTHMGTLNDILEPFRSDNAYAGQGCFETVSITDYFNSATPVNDPNLPEGTRVQDTAYDDLCDGGKITSILPGANNGLAWTPNDNFREEITTSSNKANMIAVLTEYGVDMTKFDNLLNQAGQEFGIGFYDSGKITIATPQNIYVIPAKRGISSAIAERVYGM